MPRMRSNAPRNECEWVTRRQEADGTAKMQLQYVADSERAPLPELAARAVTNMIVCNGAD